MPVSGVAEALRITIESCTPKAGDIPMTITASIGLADNQKGDDSMRAIQEHADAAMYRAKNAGRNRITAFN